MLTVREKVKIFKALGNETRFQIFQNLFTTQYDCIADDTKSDCDIISQATCVSDIADEFNFTLPTISRHLKELYDANIIKMTKIKNKIHVEPNVEVVKKVDECFTDLMFNIK